MSNSACTGGEGFWRILLWLVESAPGNLVEVAYDDLAKNPVGVLRDIYARLGLDGFEERVKPKVESHMSRAAVKGHKVNKFDELPDELRASVAARWRAYSDALGYQWG